MQLRNPYHLWQSYKIVEKTILIVDDEPDLREILELELTDAGYQTQAAAQAHE